MYTELTPLYTMWMKRRSSARLLASEHAVIAAAGHAGDSGLRPSIRRAGSAAARRASSGELLFRTRTAVRRVARGARPRVPMTRSIGEEAGLAEKVGPGIGHLNFQLVGPAAEREFFESAAASANRIWF
jgi:hypothetical protein